MWLGKWPGSSSLRHSSSELTSGSACECLVRGTKGTFTVFSVPLQAWRTVLASLRSQRLGFLWPAKWEMRRDFSTSRRADQGFPWQRGGCASSRYFGRLLRAVLLLTRKAFWQPAPFPTLQAAEKLQLPPPTHAKLFFSPQGKAKI